MKIPQYNLPSLPKKIIKHSVPFSFDNHPIINRFQRGDKVTYSGQPNTFFGVVLSNVAKPKCQLFAYALYGTDNKVFMVLDIGNVRKIGDA